MPVELLKEVTAPELIDCQEMCYCGIDCSSKINELYNTPFFYTSKANVYIIKSILQFYPLL